MNTVAKIKYLYNFVGPKMPKSDYGQYISSLKNIDKSVNSRSVANFHFVPTPNRVVNFYGGADSELLSILQSQEFVDTIYRALSNKGYGLPRRTSFVEEVVPSWSGIGAINVGDEILLNPRSINRLNPRAVFHEFGHLFHTKMQSMNGVKKNFLSMKDKYIPFLSKTEREIFKADIKRAYEEGHYRGIPFECWKKDKLFACGQVTNKVIKNYQKNASLRQVIYPLTDRFEFVADVFSLKIQGFKFSSEIDAKYESFCGPKVEEIFSEKELNDLLKLQKQIRKKKLSDYRTLY